MSVLLSCENLSKNFTMHVRGGTNVEAFSNVSFSLGEGEFLGVRGSSGCGKSSLLRCLYRTYKACSGSVHYTDKDGRVVELINADEHDIIDLRKNEIGYISQFFHVIPRLSAIEITAGALVESGHGTEEAWDKARMLLSRVGISESLWDLFPSTYSGGEKQRLNIVHAIIKKPRLLLLDEPTASLDRSTRDDVLDLIEELKAEGTAMIGVFHDIESLERLSDQTLTLHRKSLEEIRT